MNKLLLSIIILLTAIAVHTTALEASSNPTQSPGETITPSVEVTPFRTAAGGSSVTLNSGKLPLTTELSQNYPNPFNPTTVIGYTIAANSHVTLTVFDIVGNTIATLVDERQDAGRHQARFNASTLSSGIYFYKLRADGYTAVKKLTVMK
jgi:hypothetical protein